MQKLLSQASVLPCAFYQQPKKWGTKAASDYQREVQWAVPRAWGESVRLWNVIISDTASAASTPLPGTDSNPELPHSQNCNSRSLQLVEGLLWTKNRKVGLMLHAAFQLQQVLQPMLEGSMVRRYCDVGECSFERGHRELAYLDKSLVSEWSLWQLFWPGVILKKFEEKDSLEAQSHLIQSQASTRRKMCPRRCYKPCQIIAVVLNYLTLKGPPGLSPVWKSVNDITSLKDITAVHVGP